MVRLMRCLLLMIWMLILTAPTQAQGYVAISSLSYSSDGKYVAGVGGLAVNGEYIAGEGGRVVIWDGETAQLVADITLELGSPQGLLIDAAWSPGGDRLAVLRDDFMVRVLDFSNDAQPLGALLTEFEVTTFMGVRSIAWSPDGSLIAIGGDGTSPKLEFRDGAAYEYVGVSTYPAIAYRMTWHPDPQRNLIAGTNPYFNGATLYNIGGNAIHVCSTCAPDVGALPLAWNHDGSLLAIGHTDGSIFIVDAETDTVVTSMQTAIGVRDLLWTHDDQHLVSVSRSGLQVWDSLTGRLLNSPPFPDAGRIAIHPFRDDLFIYTGEGAIVNVATLLEPASTPTATFTPLSRADDWLSAWNQIWHW